MSGASVIGIDIGGTHFRIGTVSDEGKLSCFEQKSSEILRGGDAVERLADEIGDYIKRLSVSVNAVAIGFPSSVNKEKTTLYSTPNLPAMNNINLKSPLEEALRLPVMIERDVNFLLQHDINSLKIDPNGTILGFYVGTGLGNALYIDGKFYGGRNGVAGELGHIPLYGVEDVCVCGIVGCSETRCCGRYLQKLRQEIFPDTPISELFVRHSNSPELVNFVQDLAVPIAAEITILDPDFSIVAGGVVIMENFPAQLLEESIRERVRRPFPAQNLRLLFTEHTQKSGVIGGGLYAHKNFLGL